MERLDEAEYVLAVLHRMRDEVSADSELCDPDAQARIDEAIVRIHNMLRSTPSELTICSVEQEINAGTTSCKAQAAIVPRPTWATSAKP